MYSWLVHEVRPATKIVSEDMFCIFSLGVCAAQGLGLFQLFKTVLNYND